MDSHTNIARDGIPPRLDASEPDATIFLIRLEGILFEDRVAELIEQEVSYAEERIADIIERAVAARREATVKPTRPTVKRRRKPETEDRTVFG